MDISDKVDFPGVGCVIEYMEANEPVIAIVLDEQPNRYRLYTQGKKEVRLAASRVLPWSGPATSGSLNRSEMEKLMEECHEKRKSLRGEIDPQEIWELTQSEMDKAPASWFASLNWEDASIHHEAAMGHALLALKTHFRFAPPNFEIYPQEIMERRVHEERIIEEREELTSAGNKFFHDLWAVHSGRADLEDIKKTPENLAEKLKDLLKKRVADTLEESHDMWRLLTRGLPQDPHLALHLAVAWGIFPEHYNFHMDRAGYSAGEDWYQEFASEISAVIEAYNSELHMLQDLAKEDPAPFVSIDPATTRDRDDAFFVEAHTDGTYTLKVAVACPAFVWPFESDFDKEVLRRMTSIYLPEGTEHMLPPAVGWEIFSLDTDKAVPAFIIYIRLDADGECTGIEPSLALVNMLANLDLAEAEEILNASSVDEDKAELAKVLKDALKLSQLLQDKRLTAGAIIIERPDCDVTLEKGDEGYLVHVEEAPNYDNAHFVVGEIMVTANALLTGWGMERDIPLLYRTQDVVLPKEFFGVWKEPQDIAGIVRHLPPAILEDEPRQHTALGLSAYATFTSPVRRYVDLLNQGQILSFLKDGKPRLEQESLRELMPLLQARRDAVSQVQRFRPRYWKLLFFQQQGEDKWWPGVVADENDAVVTVSLPWAQLLVRGRRKLFDEKIIPGLRLELRLGKVDPLMNDISILDVREGDL